MNLKSPVSLWPSGKVTIAVNACVPTGAPRETWTENDNVSSGLWLGAVYSVGVKTGMLSPPHWL